MEWRTTVNMRKAHEKKRIRLHNTSSTERRNAKCLNGGRFFFLFWYVYVRCFLFILQIFSSIPFVTWLGAEQRYYWKTDTQNIVESQVRVAVFSSWFIRDPSGQSYCFMNVSLCPLADVFLLVSPLYASRCKPSLHWQRARRIVVADKNSMNECRECIVDLWRSDVWGWRQ